MRCRNNKSDCERTISIIEQTVTRINSSKGAYWRAISTELEARKPLSNPCFNSLLVQVYRFHQMRMEQPENKDYSRALTEDDYSIILGAAQFRMMIDIDPSYQEQWKVTKEMVEVPGLLYFIKEFIDTVHSEYNPPRARNTMSEGRDKK